MAREKATRRIASYDAQKVSTSPERTPTLYHESDWERANRLLPLVFGVCFALMFAWSLIAGW